MSCQDRCSVQTLRAAPLQTKRRTALPPRRTATSRRRAHFLRGVKYYEGGDFRWALLEFQRAYDLSPNYRILYNLGRVNQELNTYADATRAFEDYLRLGGDDIDAQRREEVLREIEALRPKLASLTITVSVAGAEVIVDNRSIGHSPLGSPISVDGGAHFVAVRHSGHVQQEKRIVLAAGDTVEQTFTLKRTRSELSRAVPAVAGSRAGVAPAPRPAPPGAPSERSGLSFAAMATWVGTGALAAGAAVTGALAYTQAKDLAELRDSPYSMQAERDSLGHKARMLAVASDALTGAAVLAGATALYLTFGGGSDGPAERDRARVGLAGTQVTFAYHY
ncbi:MAG: PEGA domain-containing protein [Verrucomicrobia bacterium]|nr:PEGA domain-containing protein [Verrucomicrobiota bacterium]